MPSAVNAASSKRSCITCRLDNARPVRIGNGAYNQVQHDIWGTMLDSVYLHAKSREHISDTLWPVLKQQVEEAIKHWREPDRGIWEVRGEPQHFTSSKIMCWVALDRGSKLAELQGEKSYAQQWRAIAEEIKADILAKGVDSRGVLTQRYGDDALDASLLLAILTRFLPADDPRVRATVLAIADELTQDGLVLRYRVEETDDGLWGEEGTFTICSFWLVSALVEIGEIHRAKHLCERLLSFASPLHLYAEEIEPRTGRHLGQFPAGVHPSGLDQRGGARHPGRGRGRQFRGVRAGQRADVGQLFGQSAMRHRHIQKSAQRARKSCRSLPGQNQMCVSGHRLWRYRRRMSCGHIAERHFHFARVASDAAQRPADWSVLASITNFCITSLTYNAVARRRPHETHKVR